MWEIWKTVSLDQNKHGRFNYVGEYLGLLALYGAVVGDVAVGE